MVIQVLNDEMLGYSSKPFVNPRIRYGARGIVFNENGEIAVLYKKAKEEYKLIGGGIEKGESAQETFLREVHEECGCVVSIDDYLGTIEEHKSLDNFKQISHIFVAHVIQKGNTHYTLEEQADQASLLWLSIPSAMEKMKACEQFLKPSINEGEMSVYHARFIVRRDYQILEYFLKQLELKNNYSRQKK